MMAASFSQIQRKEQERDREKERKSCGGSGGEFFLQCIAASLSQIQRKEQERERERVEEEVVGVVFNSV